MKKLYYNFAIAMVCLIFLFMMSGCTESEPGTIEGELIMNTVFVEEATDQADEWPCDTNIVYICLYESGVLQECIIEESGRIEAGSSVDDVSDTISIYFGELPEGDYTVAFHCEDPREETVEESQLITWINSGSEKGMLVTDPEAATSFNVVNGKTAAIGTVRFNWYVLKTTD